MVKVNYEMSYTNVFKNDLQQAVKFYLGLESSSGKDGLVGFVLYPRVVNPFLRIMETLGESRNIVVLPAFSHDGATNQPAYLIIKLDSTKFVEAVSLTNY